MTIPPSSTDRSAPWVPTALVTAGALFATYPALRPSSSEQGLDGARAFAAPTWLIAHSLAIVAFILLGFVLVGVARRVAGSPAGHLATRAAVLAAAGIGLTLPFYGAEVFGLHAIGREALDRNDPTLVDMADAVRFGIGLAFIVTGLLLLAAGAGMLARAIWRSGVLPRSSGIPLAVALGLYLPQYSASQALRVAHGLLLLGGCILLARAIRQADATPSGQPAASRPAPMGIPAGVAG